jgi:hypothetical protein
MLWYIFTCASAISRLQNPLKFHLINRQCISQFKVADAGSAEGRQVRSHAEVLSHIMGQTSDISSFRANDAKRHDGLFDVCDFKFRNGYFPWFQFKFFPFSRKFIGTFSPNTDRRMCGRYLLDQADEMLCRFPDIIVIKVINAYCR